MRRWVAWVSALAALSLGCAFSHSAEPGPGTYNQPMANAQHNNWVEGKPITRPVELWRVEFKRGAPRAYPAYVGGVFYLINEGKLRGYDAETGKQVFGGIQVPVRISTALGSFSADRRRIYLVVGRWRA